MTKLDTIEKEVKALSDEIEEAKTNLNENKGQLKALMDRLKKDFEFDSVDEAKAELEEMSKEIEKLGNNIRSKYEALNEEISNV